MTTTSHRLFSDVSHADTALTDLERCLLRLGRVQVDARAASRGRDAVSSLAARGFLSTSQDQHGASITGEITPAGRRALAWADHTSPAHVN